MKKVSTSDTHQGISKVKRYGWAALTDVPGEMRWIDKRILRVDLASEGGYQRPASDHRVTFITATFLWMAFGVLLVAEREDGSLWVFEGQHRLLAAMRRDDVGNVPAIVFKSKGRKAEAEAFYRANKFRGPIRSIEEFDARLKAEDATAMAVDKLLASTGRVAVTSNQERGVRCLAALMVYAEKEPLVLARIWPLVCQIVGNEAVQVRLLSSLMYIEARAKDGETLTAPYWTGRLVKLGTAGILRAIEVAVQYHSKGGARTWALGVLEQIVGRGRRRLRIEDDAPDTEAEQEQEAAE